MKTSLQIIGILLFFLLWGVLVGYFKTSSKKSISLPEIKSLTNETINLKNNQKKVIYIWSTWCIVCKNTLWLVKLNTKILNFFGVPFYSIEEGENLNELQKYIQEKKIQFPVFLGNENFFQKVGIRGYPTYIFINSNSEIIFFDEGFLTPFGILFRIIFLQ